MRLLRSPTGLGDVPGDTIDWSMVLLTGLAGVGVVALFWFGLQGAGHAASSRAKNPVSTRVQSLLFRRDEGWNVSKANQWAKKHGYRARDADVTAAYVRLRQRDPKSMKRLRTVTFGKGIKAVVGR